MNRRDLNLPDLDATVTEARALHESGYEQAGDWDLTQVCRHCTMALNSSIDGFDGMMPAPMRLLVKLLGMKKKMYRTRQIKPGLPAPKSAVFESANGDRQIEAGAVEELAAAAERVKAHNEPYALNPGFGVLTRDEWLEFHTIHNMHHLRFLLPKNEISAPTTPASESAKSGIPTPA